MGIKMSKHLPQKKPQKISAINQQQQQQQQKPHLGIPEEIFERRKLRIPVAGNWISQSKHRTVIYLGVFVWHETFVWHGRATTNCFWYQWGGALSPNPPGPCSREMIFRII